MANVKIIIDGPLMDGHRVTFKAPCDCTVVEYLDVRYIKDGTQVSKLFTMKDTHGNDLTGIGNLFMESAYVTAVLNTNLGYAYIQNADTNGYLEGRFLNTPGFPDYSNEIEVHDDEGFTASADGWLYILAYSGWTSTVISVNGVEVFNRQILNTNSYPVRDTAMMPVKKGDVISIVTVSDQISVASSYKVRMRLFGMR